jgi:hypothetical protein
VSATSAGSSSRLAACGARMTSSSTRSSGIPCAPVPGGTWLSTIGVRTQAGQTAVARMPCSAPSSRKCLDEADQPVLGGHVGA